MNRSKSLIFFFFLSALAMPDRGWSQKPAYWSDDPEFLDNVEWMREKMKGLMVTNTGKLDNGTPVFYGDGNKNYNLIYIRGFEYLYEFAHDLIPHENASAFLEYQLNGQRADGCIPDRVDSDGLAIYSPGPKNWQIADHALDNGAFMALSVCRYVDYSGDYDFFKKHEPNLRRAMDFTNKAPNGLVYNDPENPQCIYGFTDVVKKTGHLLMTSVLYYDACLLLEKLCRKTGVGDADDYKKQADDIKKSIGVLWDRHSGAFYAASGLCRQYDVWGTAFVLSHPELVNEEQEKKALDFLVNNYDRYVERGQIRHILHPEEWGATFRYRPNGVYQNGGYWATPLGWLVPVIAKRDPEMANRILSDCLKDFRERGVHEWVNGGVVIFPDYFVSAASVYSLVKE